MTRVEQIANSWLGTPFVSGASVKGVGADCAGLIEGIARELGIAFPTRSDVDHDLMRAAMMVLKPLESPKVGALILLSKEPGGLPLHAAIVLAEGRLIHAHWRAGVIENRFGAWFARRITHIFALPEGHFFRRQGLIWPV